MSRLATEALICKFGGFLMRTDNTQAVNCDVIDVVCTFLSHVISLGLSHPLSMLGKYYYLRVTSL